MTSIEDAKTNPIKNQNELYFFIEQ